MSNSISGIAPSYDFNNVNYCKFSPLYIFVAKALSNNKFISAIKIHAMLNGSYDFMS